MGRNFFNRFKTRHHSHKKHHGFFGGLADVVKKTVRKVEDVVEDTVDVFEGRKPEHLEKTFGKHKPIPPRNRVPIPQEPPTPVEPDTPVQPRAPPKEVVTIQHADDINQRIVLNDELQALEKIEEREVDLFGRIATKLDPPVNVKDFIKDLTEFVSKEAKEEYLEENFASFTNLNSSDINRILRVLG